MGEASDMSDADLVAPYEKFAALLLAGGFGPPRAGHWDAMQIAAHVALHNLGFAAAARAVAAGEPGVAYDNVSTVEAANLDKFVADAGGPQGLAARVVETAREQLAAYEALSDAQRAQEIPVTIHHDGAVIMDRVPRALGSMVEGNAGFHLQAHLEQLLALRP
jgi:hypothetical protein